MPLQRTMKRSKASIGSHWRRLSRRGRNGVLTMAVYVNVKPATRARMQAVKRKNTQPEICVRRLLHRMGYRFRLHQSDLPGTPDIVLRRFKKVVFVHGCFWHGHANCRRAVLPKSNPGVWERKIKENQARDLRNIAALRGAGWDALVIWECEIANSIEEVEGRLHRFLED